MLGAIPLFGVHAHVEEPRLEIGAERVNPGAVLDLRGVGFPPEEPAALTLQGAGLALDLGSVTPDVEGIFTYFLSLPAELPEGTYVVSAAVSDRTVLSPPFTVSGLPLTDDESGGQRDQDEPLLAPLPTLPPASVVPESQIDPSTPEQPPLSATVLVTAAILILGCLALVVIGFRWLRRRS